MPFSFVEHPLALRPPPLMSRESAWLQHTPLVPILMGLLRPRTFVELGTHRGDSYCAFCEAALRLKTGTQCAAVDTWTGDPHAGEYGPDVLAGLRQFHDRRYLGVSRLLQMTFDAALPTFPDQCIDLLHIDGLHTYEAVRHDYESWRPKLTDRGVVLFHDTTARLPGFGVWKCWEELAPTAPSFNMPHGWGLGILAVGSNVPPAFLEFLIQLQKDEALVPLLAAVGERNELLAKVGAAGEALATCHDLVNQWRQVMGMGVRNATASVSQAVQFPGAVGPVVVHDLLQTANDAAAMHQELEMLRRQAPPPPPLRP